MFARIAAFLIRRRWAVSALLAALSLAMAVFAGQIRFDFTPQAVFAGHDELVEASESFKQRFRHEDAVLLLAVEATGPDDVLSQQALDWQLRLIRRLRSLPRVEQVRSLATVEMPRMRIIGPPWITSTPILLGPTVDQEAAERVRAIVNSTDLYDGVLVSRDRRAAAILVSVDPDARDVDSMRTVRQSVDSALAAAPPPSGFVVRRSGLPELRVDIVDQLMSDQALLLPIAGLLFLIVLAATFRSVAGTLLPLLSAGLGLAWTIGSLSAMGQSLNIISNVLPVLLLVIGVSSCVHILIRYQEELAWADGDRLLATRQTMEHMALACLLTYLTTAIGFFSLITANSRLLRTFAWQSALGMVFLYVCTTIVFGALLPLVPSPPAERKARRAGLWLIDVIVAAGARIARHPNIVCFASAVVVATALWLSRGLVINSYMVETYDADHPTMQTMRLVEQQLGGFIPLEISIQAERPGQFSDPEVYRRVAAITRFAADQEGVLFARSYVDLHQNLYERMRRSDDRRRELPTIDEEGARRLRFTDRIFARVSDSVGYDAFLAPDGREARVLLRVQDLGTRRTLKLIERIEAQLAQLFPADSGVAATLTGDAYLNAKAMDGFVRDMFGSLIAASAIIFGVIAVLFRSLRVGLIATFPNITPLVVTLGYMGVRGYDLNAGNVIVFAISLGIAVDDTIHFLSRYREELARTQDIDEAIEQTFRGTGRAIVLTTVLIVSGLSVLLLSDFVPTRRFAELTSVTMAAALAGDLLLLPACLKLFWSRPRATPEPVRRRTAAAVDLG